MLHCKREIFLASPISGFASSKQYSEDRAEMLKFIRLLESKMGNVFYAGRKLLTNTVLDADDEIKRDFEAIDKCSCFVMFYPEKIVSSVLVEAGYALALRKPSIYFVRSSEDLPFLLQFAAREFTNTKLYEYKSLDEVFEWIDSGVVFPDW